MPDNPHKYLRNQQQTNQGFKKTRGFSKPLEEDDEPETVSKIIQPFQKDKLRLENALLFLQRKTRREEKTIDLPAIIDLVRIRFFAVFNLDLQKKFMARYGLGVVEFTDFNKTVLFEITNEQLFRVFTGHIENVIDSNDGDSYEGKPYNLIALINSFEFLTDKGRLGTLSTTGFLISLISSVNRAAAAQRQLMLQTLSIRPGNISSYERYPDIILVKELNRAELSSLVKNFDIIKHVSGTRAVKLRPGAFGQTRREFGFSADIPENLPVVGIIDTGISIIDPLRDLITNIHYDHTGNGAYFDESGHGTMVAGLIALGDDFQKEVRDSYQAKAKLAIIKAIHNENDPIDIPRLLNDIRDAKQTHGIRLFNMSLNLGIVKPYNASFGSFAWELDKLAYEEDILIFVSVGNYDDEDLLRLLNEDYHPAHDYPQFFYDLNSTSANHSCWFTNIQEPAESLNNISVGALAGNIESDGNHDATPASEYPAYYSRKYHVDSNQDVNGTPFQNNQKNKFLNKPDLVFEGGDLFIPSAGIEILRSPMEAFNPFYARSCGTSLATPLITSLAAEILYVYPQLHSQSVKALLINNSFSAAGKRPPAFQNLTINLYQKLTGFGKPAKQNLLLTDDNTVTWIIEDSIDNEEFKVIPIKIPPFVAEAENKLHIEATLCYSFMPVRDNHLNYLPLHISFGLFKYMDASDMAESDASEYRIKNSITWSEDFFGIENRLFSNTQRQSFNIQSRDLINLKNEFTIALRCSGKKEIPTNDRLHIEKDSHRFSLVITLSEIPLGNASGRLYEEINALNIVENIASLDADLDASV